MIDKWIYVAFGGGISEKEILLKDKTFVKLLKITQS